MLPIVDAFCVLQGCRSIGGPYNPSASGDGGSGAPGGHLGVITAGDDGRSQFRLVKQGLKLSEIIGRAVAITDRGESRTERDGDTDDPIACGIIARSAGVFQNPKRICLCDGVVVWDERDRPLAGRGRKPCCGGDGKDSVKGGKPCCKV